MKTLKTYHNSKTKIKDFLLSKGYRHDQIFYDGGVEINGVYCRVWRLFTGERVFLFVKQSKYPFNLYLIDTERKIAGNEQIKTFLETGEYVPPPSFIVDMSEEEWEKINRQ